MRITGGKFSGRRISCPPGTIRPAMDRMRESIFASLGSLEGLSFLDLFSGSGVIALEAASRGAQRVHSVEKDFRKKDMLEQNLAMAAGVCSYSLGPVERFMLKRQECFDIIFLDPPFPYRHKNDLLVKLINSALVREGSLVLIHYPEENRLEDSYLRKDGSLVLSLDHSHEYGRSLVRRYRVLGSTATAPQNTEEIS